MRPSMPAAAVMLLLLCSALPAAAADAGVPLAQRLNDTGLTRCTRDFRSFTHDCAGTGQDADSGRDAVRRGNLNGHAGFAFLKVCNSGEAAGTGSCTAQAALGDGPDDWGCTFDRVTGLEWEVKTNDAGPRDVHWLYTNFGNHGVGDASSFVDAVNAAGLCGANDWRLPLTGELQGIEDFDHASPKPSIDLRFFPNTLVAHYWNAEPFVGQETTVAWVTSFLMDPKNISVTAEVRSTPNGVRLVRGGATGAARYLARGAEVEAVAAHLVWQRCSVGQHWDGTTCAGTPRGFDFGGAIAYAQQHAAATGKPWRVPNAKELNSIVDHARQHPAIDTDVFPGTDPDLYWTSTAYAWTATGAWAVTFDGGQVLAYYGGFGLDLRLVRDAD